MTALMRIVAEALSEGGIWIAPDGAWYVKRDGALVRTSEGRAA